MLKRDEHAKMSLFKNVVWKLAAGNWEGVPGVNPQSILRHRDEGLLEFVPGVHWTWHGLTTKGVGLLKVHKLTQRFETTSDRLIM